ncbi:MAG: AAA family ATPase [Anaerolineales bacterium]|nr:AAA family ATPase [Anaerolineales bacterium]
MNNLDLSGDEVHSEDLTWREQDVLVLLAERLTNREIADRLHLAESTVKDYVGKILSKLYVKNRREAVERAKTLGLLDLGRKTVAKPQVYLPAEPTPFVGRRDELDEVKRRLAETRLLTLTGPGGIGKTRLAVKAAEEIAADFEDGCFFISLAPIRSVEPLVQTIAEAVKSPLATHEDPQHQLLRYLQNRKLLLVMDNFEHLLDGVGIVSEILQAAPAVKILATSRERLNLQSETINTVAGMAFPDPVGSVHTLNYDAITLFVQSASKVRPGYDPSPDELEQIANICLIMQGMPLAIELAAAWLHILNVDEIAKELKRGLDILSAEVHDVPDRHRSIRAVFDHSWSLLDQDEKQIFMKLSVFRGGFTREAAQQVTGASLQLLAGLVNKSFLSLDPDSSRLEVHELLRQYAQERLEETPQVSISAQEAHADYFATFMQQKGVHLRGKRQTLVLNEIEHDIENVRAAWRYYLAQRNSLQMWKFISGIWHVYWIRWWNHAGMELFAEVVRVFQGEEDEDSVALRALAMAHQSYFMAWLDLSDQGYELAKESTEILQQHDRSEALVFAYDSLALNAYMLGRMTEEAKAIRKMYEITTEMDDKWLLAFTLFAAGMVALIEGDYGEAMRLAETNLNLYEEIGDASGSTMPLIVMGHAALARGKHEEARELYLRCLHLSEEVDFHYSIQTATKYLAKVAISVGKYAEAERYLHQSLALTKEIGFVRDIVNLLYEYARLRVAQENSEQAVELLALVVQHPASNQTRWLEGRIRDSAKNLLANLEDELSPEAYSAALERGQELELDEIVADLVGP